MEIVRPAQLAYLTIYNPSLGRSDENLQEQIVYYYSSKSRESRKLSSTNSEERAREERNEKLRQIGLAQGMVEFAKAFSDGTPVDAVDSEKSRIIIHELEPGWWILASIDLTQIQSKPDSITSKEDESSNKPEIEYSAREVCSQTLLLRHLLKAHSVFLLHHAPSLGELYVRLTRSKFCAALERFWDRFVKEWDVLLHGVPAVDIFNGLKLAAGGELGIGVGEEEWGSGEREVLEGFIHRTEGLIDLIVSRFGDLEQQSQSREESYAERLSWLGSGNLPNSADGVIFTGIKAVTRPSSVAIATWMEWILRSGQTAYGVQDNPHAPKRRRRRKPLLSDTGEVQADFQAVGTPHSQAPGTQDLPPGIPPPIVTAARKSLDNALKRADKGHEKSSDQGTGGKESAPGTEALMKFMTFGLYGSGWGISNSQSNSTGENANETVRTQSDSAKAGQDSVSGIEKSKGTQALSFNRRYQDGCFLIGLKGDLNDEGETDGEEGTDSPVDPANSLPKAWNNRILLRTLHVERKRPSCNDGGPYAAEGDKLSTTESFDRVQVVVYVRRPFMFTFLFELQTPTLNYTSFYRSIHHQLGPLQRPLLRSTSPTNVFSRLYDTVFPRTVTPIDSKQPIYDLVYDPLNMTLHTTIPSIPEAGDAIMGKDHTTLWSRLDALNVHSQIVSTFTATRRHVSELERTAKTSRGWWIVWIRLPSGQSNLYREAFLVRKATDYVDDSARKANFGFGRDVGSGWGSSAGKLAEGIGIDTRRYVEGLLSLNR